MKKYSETKAPVDFEFVCGIGILNFQVLENTGLNLTPREGPEREPKTMSPDRK
ncbi:hypothetical protein [Roseibium sp. M-1]